MTLFEVGDFFKDLYCTKISINLLCMSEKDTNIFVTVCRHIQM